MLSEKKFMETLNDIDDAYLYEYISTKKLPARENLSIAGDGSLLPAYVFSCFQHFSLIRYLSIAAILCMRFLVL